MRIGAAEGVDLPALAVTRRTRRAAARDNARGFVMRVESWMCRNDLMPGRVQPAATVGEARWGLSPPPHTSTCVRPEPRDRPDTSTCMRSARTTPLFAPLPRMYPSARQRHSRFGGPHLDHMRVRSALFDLLLRIAREDRLDQWAFAHMFNISQPRASDAVHRRMERFNSETLIDMLARLGVRIELHVAERLPYKQWNFPR